MCVKAILVAIVRTVPRVDETVANRSILMFHNARKPNKDCLRGGYYLRLWRRLCISLTACVRSVDSLLMDAVPSPCVFSEQPNTCNHAAGLDLMNVRRTSYRTTTTGHVDHLEPDSQLPAQYCNIK